MGAEGWPLFEFELLMTYILQCALPYTPGSHEEEYEAWQSAVSRKSDNEVRLSVQYTASFEQLSAECIQTWITRLDRETGMKRNYATG